MKIRVLIIEEREDIWQFGENGEFLNIIPNLLCLLTPTNPSSHYFPIITKFGIQHDPGEHHKIKFKQMKTYSGRTYSLHLNAGLGYIRNTYLLKLTDCNWVMCIVLYITFTFRNQRIDMHAKLFKVKYARLAMHFEMNLKNRLKREKAWELNV